jgi:hypothetical protein
VVQNFNLSRETGLLCLNKSTTYKKVINDIINSPARYLDEFSNICYNLYLYVTKYPVYDLSKICYNSLSCAFNYFKICINDCNFYKPTFNRTSEVAVLYLENILKWEAFCLHNFNFLYPKLNSNYNFNLTVVSKNNQTHGHSLFSINNTLDCLTFELLNGVSNRKFITGKHTLNVTVYDNCHQNDSQQIHVYILDNCEQKMLVSVNFDPKYVYQNREAYST